MRLTEEEKYWLWLAGADGMGAATFYAILGAFVDARTACENFSEVPKKLKLPAVLAENWNRCMSAQYRDRLLEIIEKSGMNVLTRLSQDYPKMLSDIDNPPPVLYFKGCMPNMEDMNCGIVGTRTPTRTGVQTAIRIAGELAEQGVVIVSGMARGVDTAAHNGALKARGSTVAVLGCGADVVYPPENRRIYDEIVENGAVVSEFKPGAKPELWCFPQRNRIIAGLSHALIAGEGGQKSGARITVDYALNQGKEVFVMPCNMASKVSRLPGYLVESGAMIASGARQLMECMGWDGNWDRGAEEQSASGMNADEQLVYAMLDREELTADEICAQTGIDIKSMNMLLTLMEIKDSISALPGGRYGANK